MTTEGNDVVIYWNFEGDNIQLITPFNARLYMKENSLNTENKKVTMNLFDSDLNKVIATREITLPDCFMKEVIAAIDNQMGQEKPEVHSAKWQTMSIYELKKVIHNLHPII